MEMRCNNIPIMYTLQETNAIQSNRTSSLSSQEGRRQKQKTVIIQACWNIAWKGKQHLVTTALVGKFVERAIANKTNTQSTQPIH